MELNEEELENALGGQYGSYEENKERFDSSMNKFKDTKSDELSMDELSHVEAGNGLSYEENKRIALSNDMHDPSRIYRAEDTAQVAQELGKVKQTIQLGELSEDDLERYMGGIRIEGEEYDTLRK